jgi:hypothetical protein
MHHFSVATLVEMAASESASGMEWLALEGIARQKLYVASGFAATASDGPGRTASGISTGTAASTSRYPSR